MSACVPDLCKAEAVVESSGSIGPDDLDSERLARATSLIKQVLNYRAANPRASISWQQSYVNAAYLFVAALDHHPPDRRAFKEYDVVVRARVLGFIGAVLSEELHP